MTLQDPATGCQLKKLQSKRIFFCHIICFLIGVVLSNYYSFSLLCSFKLPSSTKFPTKNLLVVTKCRRSSRFTGPEQDSVVLRFATSPNQPKKNNQATKNVEVKFKDTSLFILTKNTMLYALRSTVDPDKINASLRYA